MQFTSEQAQAITLHDRNLIVSAGAGSGKTRVLVERYLALLAAQRDWSLNELVAITFTHKAAQEMRDRVRSGLMQRIADATTDADRNHWARHLAAMDSARIDTIHSMCATILRANAAEAAVDPKFSILDEHEADALRSLAVDYVLKGAAVSGGASPVWLELFTHYSLESIREALMRFITTPLQRVGLSDVSRLEYWRATREAVLSQVIPLIVIHPQVTQFMGMVQSVAVPNDTMGQKVETARAVIEQLAAFTEGQALAPYLDHIETVRALNMRGGGKVWKEDSALSGLKSQVAIIRDLFKTKGAWVALLGDLSDVDTTSATLTGYWLTLLDAVQRAYATLKYEQSALDFDDLENKTVQLFKDYPQLSKRYVRQAFKHVMVDEFQDTNAHQWAIVEALTQPETLVSGAPATAFLVGDAKQSIYGFRGADVSVFNRVRGQVERGNGDSLALSRSFRSHTLLVDGFNALFSRLFASAPDSLVPDYEVRYEPMVADREPPQADTPPLELIWLDKHERDASGGFVLNDKGRHATINADDIRQHEAHQLATYIRHLVEDEQRLIYDRETRTTRPIDYGDIALLFRVSTHFEVYEAAFRAANLPYVTHSGRGYYGRQEVWDMLSLLEFLDSASNDLALAIALRSPLFSLSDETLLALRLRTGNTKVQPRLWDALVAAAEGRHPYVLPADVPEVSRAYSILQRLQMLYGHLSVYELLERILAETGYLAVLTGLPNGAQRRANVQKLVKQATLSQLVSARDFTDYLRDMTEREVREGEAELDTQNALTLMTVHSSKGLEFPFVVLPSMTWNRRTDSDFVLADEMLGMACKPPNQDEKPYFYRVISTLQSMRDEAENKRLFYVAMTRAQDYVLMSGTFGWSAKDSLWKANGWGGYLLDLFDELCGSERPPQQVTLEGVPLKIHYPHLQPDDLDTHADDTDEPPTNTWLSPDVQARKRLPIGETEPPLARPVEVSPLRFVEYLTATQIADLGAADYDSFYEQRFRQSVLGDSAAQVHATHGLSRKSGRVSHRIMGDIVHEMLHHWDFSLSDVPDSVRDQLEAFAWKHGVVDDDTLNVAVTTAIDWLRGFQHSLLYRQMRRAKQRYHELPFIYQSEQRTIHGILDVLFEDKHGGWVIVDYKSSYVHGYVEYNDDRAERDMLRLLREHAKRYELQVGVYAAAIRNYLAMMGTPVEPSQLKVIIYYLRYGRSVTIPTAKWEQALDGLESKIGKLIEDTATDD